jgi:hypothetical protein
MESKSSVHDSRTPSTFNGIPALVGPVPELLPAARRPLDGPETFEGKTRTVAALKRRALLLPCEIASEGKPTLRASHCYLDFVRPPANFILFFLTSDAISLTPSACARTRAREIIEEFPSDRHSDRMAQGPLVDRI